MRIILLPGLDGTGLLFEPLLRSFSPSVLASAMAYPRDRETSYDELAEEILPKLPQSEPFALLGESYGGPLSLKLAAARPHGLRALVLSASFVTCPHDYVPKWSERLIIPAFFYPAAIVSRMKALVGRYSTPEIQSLIERSLGTVAPAVLASRIKEVINIDATTELMSCQAPILYIQGTHDYVVPAGNLARIRKLRPDVQVARIDAPHMVLQTQAGISAKIIEAFITEQVTT